jgi:hypothetical protein
LNIPSGVVSTTKTSFVYKGLSQGAQVAYFGKDKNPDLANSINAVEIRENEIVAQNAAGFLPFKSIIFRSKPLIMPIQQVLLGIKITVCHFQEVTQLSKRFNY